MPGVPSRIMGGLTALAFAIALSTGPITSVASAEPPPPPPSVSLTAEHTTVHVGESIHLTATAGADVGPTPYSIRIFDDDTHSEIAVCGSGTTCAASISLPWSENEHPTDRHYHAEVGTASGGERTTSNAVTVAVERYVFSVALSSNHSSVTVPDSFTLKATTNRDVAPTPYSIKIIEDGTNREVGSCGSGTECGATVATTWAENENPHARTFHAVVSSSTYTAGESSTVTVGVQRYSFDVSLQSDHGTVQIPNSFTLTATVSRDVGPTPYAIRIIEDGTNREVTSCGSGTTCATTVATSWSENRQPHARNFHAAVSSSTYTAGQSGSVSVAVLPFFFTVNLTLTYVRTDETGKSWYKATATTDRDVGPTPYSIKIRKDGSTVAVSCGSSTSCTGEVEGGHSYTASVEDSEGHNFGGSTIYDLQTAGLAALFPSASGVCSALLTYPGTHLAGSSLSDQTLACENAVRAGATVAGVIAAVEATDQGGKAIWWLLHEGTVAQPGFELPAPTETDPYPAPTALPEVWPVHEVAAVLTAKNPAAELTEGQAREIATRCLWDAALSDLDGAGECETLPIFISGSDVATATLHDLNALRSNPGWVRLNYEAAGVKEARGESRSWYKGLGGCSAEAPEGTSCDEYPFYASEQGGPNAVPTPSLEYINKTDNSLQGSLYSGFLSSCKLAEQQAFLAVPAPPIAGIPTTRLCN